MNRLFVLVSLLVAGCTIDPPRAERPAPPAGEALEIRFLDVGQGDAVLLRSGGKTALIDAGPSDGIVSQLRSLGVDTLDLLIASHNHADHIGGMDAVLDELAVRFYLDNGHPATTRIQERVLERVERHGATYLAASPRTLSLGSARLRILPSPAGAAKSAEEQNNRSVGVVVEQGDFQALLTGDSEVEAIGSWLKAGAIPDVEVLKAAHHGSHNGVTPEWIARARPEVVVISLGADNSYGHPHEAAMRSYCTGERQVYRTDRSGTVSIRVDSMGAFRIEEERTPRKRACAGVPRER